MAAPRNKSVSLVGESVRGCRREADARGPAFPRDLHSVTAVTLSLLGRLPAGSAFPELEIQGFLNVLGLFHLGLGRLVGR